MEYLFNNKNRAFNSNLTNYKKAVSLITRLTMSLCMVSAFSVYAESDAFLAEQRVENPKVTEALISEVKQEAQKPVSDQRVKHDQKATEQANQIKKENLEENATSDYELKRKTDTAKLLNVAKREYIPAKQSHVIYTVGYENKNVHFGNKAK